MSPFWYQVTDNPFFAWFGRISSRDERFALNLGLDNCNANKRRNEFEGLEGYTMLN